MQTHDVGEPATIATSWYGSDGEGAEPLSIALTIFKPDGTTISKTKADMSGAASTGSSPLDVWRYTTIADAMGLWRYDVEGEVDGATVKLPSGSFLVGEGGEGGGPCEPWTTWADVEGCAEGLDATTPQQRELAIDDASEILFNLTGRVYTGICQTTRSLCFTCRSCFPTICTCAPANGIDLGYPVWGVWDVIVDGETLPAGSYEVLDRRYLVRTDGGSLPYPSTITDPNQFRASWAFGHRIPKSGRNAARRFAVEIAKGCVGDSSCQIPTRVTNITRGGVTYTILDSMKMIEEGRTGIALVDLWIVADRKGRKPKPRIFLPAAGGTRRIA